MDDFDAENPLNVLESMEMLLAFVFKMEGESGIKQLIGDKLSGAEYVHGWASKLSALRLYELADLIAKIGNTMPPDRVLPNPGARRELIGSVSANGLNTWLITATMSA